MKTLTDEEMQKLRFALNEEDNERLNLDLDDAVHSPKHYKSDSGLEAIEVIQDFVPDPYSYYMGNVLKYVLRHTAKNAPRQDLEKARWYLNKMIEDWD